MNLIQNSSAPVFTGEFPHRVEGKNRLTVPADWRFGEEVELFLTARSDRRCIGVFTRTEVERLTALATTNLTPSARAQALHKFGRKMRRVMMDKAGRISLPEDFRAEFKIDKDVVFSGAVDTFDIWHPDDFKAASAPANGDAEMWAQLGI